MDGMRGFIIGLLAGTLATIFTIAHTPGVTTISGEKGSVLTTEYKDVVYRLVPLNPE